MLGFECVDCMFALLVSGVREVGDASSAPNAEVDDIDNAAETAAPDIKTSPRVTNADAGLLMCASSDQVRGYIES